MFLVCTTKFYAGNKYNISIKTPNLTPVVTAFLKNAPQGKKFLIV
jgi:hypothetical protein